MSSRVSALQVDETYRLSTFPECDDGRQQVSSNDSQTYSSTPYLASLPRMHRIRMSECGRWGLWMAGESEAMEQLHPWSSMSFRGLQLGRARK